jgi:aryl-alcohol dehydrogenase-like predicted oxidoreductase
MSDASPESSLVRRGRFGMTDMETSVLGLGTNNFGVRLDFSQTRDVVHAALDAGINFYDSADSYGEGESERFLGRLLKDRRSEVVIATKFGWGEGPGDGVAHGARKAVHAALEASLRRLGTDYVDLYYYHRPDGVTPIGETIAALDELIDAGTVRYAACSNVTSAEVLSAQQAAAEGGWRGFAAVQNEYSLLRLASADVLEVCRERGLAFVPFRPLAQGLLSGKYRPGHAFPEGSRLLSRPEAVQPSDLDGVQRLDAYARQRGHTLLELAVSSLVCTPGVGSVIAGAMTPDQVRANVAAASWMLLEGELTEIRESVPA